MTSPSAPIYHGDTGKDGRYYQALGDIFLDADSYFNLTGHTLAEHFDRYGWRAEDVRRHRVNPVRKNILVQAFFRDAEPSKRERLRVQRVVEALNSLGRCGACAASLSNQSRVVCKTCVP
jgi:hypothetical protein